MSVSQRNGSSARLVYATPEYAESFASIGKARELVHSGGWVIERAIPETDACDAMGPYPLFQCGRWERLSDDLQLLSEQGCVSVVLVTDPMQDIEQRGLHDCFDVVRPFKRHYLADLELPYQQSVSRHHRYYVRKSAKSLRLDVPDDPVAYLDEWCQLYEQLMVRHTCRDLRRFSREAFARLLAMPETVLLRALAKDEAVGAEIFLLNGEVAYAHLTASSSEGYRLGAPYFLSAEAMTWLRGRVRYINWGGGVGDIDGVSDGLSWYKAGWSTHSRLSYLLGKITDGARYSEIVTQRQRGATDYFPAYRAGEYGNDNPRGNR